MSPAFRAALDWSRGFEWTFNDIVYHLDQCSFDWVETVAHAREFLDSPVGRWLAATAEAHGERDSDDKVQLREVTAAREDSEVEALLARARENEAVGQLADPTLINLLRKTCQLEAIVEYVVVFKRCRLFSGGRQNAAQRGFRRRVGGDVHPCGPPQCYHRFFFLTPLMPSLLWPCPCPKLPANHVC